MRADGLDTLHPRTRTLVERELEPGERLLWCATPVRTYPLVVDLVPILFGGAFAGFAVFWIAIAFAATSTPKDGNLPDAISRVFPLVGVPFLAVGLAIMTSP